MWRRCAISRQIILYYPNDLLTIVTENSNVSGRAGSLFPPPDNNPTAGLFQLVNLQDVNEEATNICKIVAIQITSADYDERITYLPAPDPLPVGCDADCEAAVRAYAPVGTEISIKGEYGITVATMGNVLDFISNCKAEILNKNM